MNIILTTMIKNEERVITRMLDSTIGIATYYSITDTGSTDSTIQVVEEWCKSNNAKYKIDRSEFVSFGETRTKTMGNAKQFAIEQGLDLENTYLLLLDADMVLQNHGFKESLEADNYQVIQFSANLEYPNIRLVRASKINSYANRTHECLHTIGSVAMLETLKILDIGDGGCKSDKFERDIKLLEMDLADDPNNYRALFYLGQSYDGLKQFDKAIEYYMKRATFPDSWDEEAWMALYRCGIIYEIIGNNQEAEKIYLEAWNRRPWRNEPLVRLVKLLINAGQHKKAIAFARCGLGTPYPKQDVLFIEDNCYCEELHNQIGIAGYYAGVNALLHCDELILRGKYHRHNALQSAAWYVQPLAAETRNLGKLFEDVIPTNYHPCNPSIIALRDGFGLALRTVNYTINADGSYNYPGYVHTRTLYCELDKSYNRISAIPLENPIGKQVHIRGIEDVRLYDKAYTTLYGLGVRCDGEKQQPTMFNFQWSAIDGRLLEQQQLSDGIEKNWLPFITYRHQWPEILYATNPFTVITLDGRVVTKRDLKINASDFRGSSNVISYLNGWFWIIHQVVVLAGQTKRKYLHRFCWINESKDPESIRISRPFCFQKSQIEFCAGACEGPIGELLITYGVEDHEAYLAIVNRGTVIKMLGD